MGSIFGMLAFGRLADTRGRLRAQGVSLQLLCWSSICSSLTFGEGTWAVMASLILFRLAVGFGVGAAFPVRRRSRRVSMSCGAGPGCVGDPHEQEQCCAIASSTPDVYPPPLAMPCSRPPCT